MPVSECRKKLIYYYDKVKTGKFRKLYSNLRNMEIKNVIDGEWYLRIAACKVEENGTDYVIDVFDENDKDLYFGVSVYQKGDDMLYSIVLSPHEEFLQYLIDERTLKKYTPEAILAHALWELTWYGYEDERSLP